MAGETDIVVRIIQQIVADPQAAQRAGASITDALKAEQARLRGELDATTSTASRGELAAEIKRLEALVAQAQRFETAVVRAADPSLTGQERAGARRTAASALGLQGQAATQFGRDLKSALDTNAQQVRDIATRFGGIAQSLQSAGVAAGVGRGVGPGVTEGQQALFDEVAAMADDFFGDGSALEAAMARVSQTMAEGEIMFELLNAEGGILADVMASYAAVTRSGQAQIEASIKERLAADDLYAKALATSAQAEATITAKKNEILASTDLYGKTLATAAAAQAKINADKQEELAANDAYAQNLARAAIAQARINADKDVLLARSREYSAQLARSALAQARVDANKNETLAAGKRYAAELARGAVAQATINADKQEDLATNQFYINEVARGAVAQAAVNAGKQQILAGEASYIAAISSAAVAQAQINAAKQITLASEPAYARALADASLAQASINRQKQQELASGGRYAVELADAATAQAAINAQKKRQLLATPAYAQALAQGENLQTQINNAKKRELLLLNQGAAQAEGDILDRGLRTQRNIALANDLNTPEGALAFRADKTAESRRKANEARELALSDEYLKARTEEIANKRLLAAKEQQMLIVNEEYIAAQRLDIQNSLAAAAAKARATAQEAATPEGARARLVAVENQGVLAAQARVEKEFQRVAELNALLGFDRAKTAAERQSVELAVQQNRLDTQLNALINERIRLERISASRAANAGVPRRQQPFKPDASPDGGIGFVQGFRSTLRFGAASFAIYGLARGISEAVREATELDRIFNQINRQFESQFALAGPDEAAAQFRAFKDEVFETAALTGQAADEVASVGFQLQGAFGGDTQKAISETRDAIIAARVTGLEVGEVIDSFTALTQSFVDNDLTIRRVSDAALQLQENLGVLAKETITFAADLAPLGAELGFTAEKLAAIGAVAQQTSGRSGTALAEAFGRVLPQIQENAVDIIQIFSALGPEVGNALKSAFRESDINAVFDILLQNFEALDDRARGQLVDTLGGRREAQSIIGVLSQGSKVFEQYGAAQDSAGKTTEYFNDLQETLQQRVARLGEEFKRLVQVLFESGLKDFFLDFVDLLETVVRLFENFIGLASTLGGLVGPLTGPLGLLLQSALLLRGGTALRSGFRSLTGRGTAQAAGAAGGAGAIYRNALTSGAAAGAATSKGFLAGFAGLGTAGGIAGLGIAAGAILFSSIDSGVRKSAEEAASKFRAGFDEFDLDTPEGVSGFDARVLDVSRNLGLGFGAERERIVRLFEQGKSIEELQAELRDRAFRSNSLFQQVLDAAPGELSKAVADDQARVNEVIQLVFDNFIGNAFSEGLSTLSADTQEQNKFRQRANELIQDALSVSLGLADPEIRSAATRLLSGDQTVSTPLSDIIGGDLDAFRQRAADALSGYNKEFQEEVVNALISAVEENPDTTLLSIPEINQDELNKKARAQLRQVEDDIASAETGDELVAVAAEIERKLLEEDFYEDSLEPILSALLNPIRGLGEAAIENSQRIQDALIDIEEIQAEVELGITTQAALDRARKDLAQLYFDLETAEGNAEGLKLLNDARESLYGRFIAELDGLDAVGDLTGDTVPVEELRSRIEGAINSGVLDLSIDQEADLAERLVEAVRQRRQAQAAFIEDEAEKAEFLAQSISGEIGADAEQALLTRLLSSNSNLQNQLDLFTDSDAQAIEDILRRISDIVVSTNKSLAEAAKDALQLYNNVRYNVERLRIETARNAQSLAIILDQESADLFTLFSEDAQKDLGKFSDAQQQQLEEIQRILDAEIQGFADNLLGGIPGQAEDPAERAKRAKDEADKRRREALEAAAEYARALEELRAAKVDLALAEIENDPVKAASYEAFLAAAGIQTAKTQAERIRAQAEKIRADRTLREAIFDVQQSQIDLLIAIADAAGQTIEAAELQIRAIREQLANARSEGLGDAQINRLKAELVGAEAALRDATLSERRDYYSFLEETGKITQAQLINYLQSLLAIPDLTQDQIRDIQREIYGLRQQLGQDFQFNLPSNLSLPTLYEVRRLDQSAGIGSGYNDNRTINLTINASTTASADDIANAVVDVMGDPTRSGTAVRRF